MKRMLAIALLATVVPTFAYGQQKTTAGAAGAEEEIKSLMTQIRKAQMEADTETMGRLIPDDYTFTNPMGQVMTKQQAISEIKAGTTKFNSMQTDDVKVRLFGDAAVATGHLTVRGERKGQDISGEYRATWVFVKNQNRWQPVAAQSTRIEPAGMAGADQPATAKTKKTED